MKHWTYIQLSDTNLLPKDSKMSDLFKSEILDTRIAVSKIFSEFRLSGSQKVIEIKHTKATETTK